MKTVLIVGASSGIGYAAASLFLKEGYRVVNVSRTECLLPGAENILCDVTVREDLDKALSTLASDRLDCFVYSAGFSMSAPLEYVQEGDYRYLFEVNFFAFVHCLQVLLPALRRSEGVVCAVSSLAAVLPIPFDSYYTSSKAALNAFIEALSYELDGEPVRVYSLMPGGTKTGFTEKRKVYPPSAVDGYSKQLSLATEKLAKTEQNGSSPEKVAKAVFDICTQPACVPVKSACFANKCAHLASSLIPARLKKFLIKTMYFMEEEN